MQKYLENLTSNVLAVAFGLFGFVAFAENTPSVEIESSRSIPFLLLTITIPSLISGIVTIAVEYFKNRRGRRR